MRAQLILVGGRAAIPNMLTVKYQCPDVIVPITSTESKKDLPRLEEALKAVHPTYQLEQVDPVDAFNFSQIYDVCEKAVKKHPDAEWIFNITTGTTIMSIAAYEVAKKYSQSFSIKCWYINTSQSRVVSLAEESKENIFQITVPQYAAAYNRVLLPGDLDDARRDVEQHWLPFAQRLGKDPGDASLLKSLMSKTGNDKPGKNKEGEDKSKYYTMLGLSDQVYSLLEYAQSLQLVCGLTRNTTSISFRLDYSQYSFFNGDWLEAYVWDEARKLMLLDDCQWNHTIEDGKSKNELDVVMTYKAQLLIVECKTGVKDSFDPDTLNKLDSVANLLGGRFVSKLLVTSLPLPSRDKDREEFLAQAKSRRIVVVASGDLPGVGKILQEEALEPTYSRI
jgi:hypothetical protein